MAERVSFLFGAPSRVKISTSKDINALDIVEFDATISEDHNISAELTDHPVEVGSKITDHYRILPKSITVNGIVSNNPLPGFGPLVPGVAAVQGLVTSLQSRISAGPASEAYDKLERAMKNGELLKISTTLKDYNNMLITSVSVKRDSNTGNILNSIISLREVRLAKVKTIVEPEAPADEKDAPLNNQGRKEKSAATANQSSSAAIGKSNVSNPF